MNIFRMVNRFSNNIKPKFLYFSKNFTSQSKNKITHVIFDFDGVIVDSEKIFYEINKLALQKYNIEYTKKLKLEHMGRRLDEGTKWLLKKTGLLQKVSIEDYINLFDEILKSKINEFQEMPGARKLIEHLHKNEVPMAICTGSTLSEFNLKTKKCQDLIEKFKTIVLTGDDPEVKRGKPAPDPFLITMKRMSPVPTSSKNVLVFEDSLNGVISALEANNTVIWIPQNDFKLENWFELKTKYKPKVAEILDSMNDFNPVKYGLSAY